MKLVKWNNVPTMWPSIFDDNWPFDDWSDKSSGGLNVYETEDSVVVEAQVPGVPEDKVEVTIEGNVLCINANYEETEEEKKKKKTIYKATRQSNFSYSTTLPRMVDGSKAEAVIENGVVKVSVPKTEEEKPKKIAIKKK